MSDLASDLIRTPNLFALALPVQRDAPWLRRAVLLLDWDGATRAAIDQPGAGVS
jgi:hypothetical protein